MSAESLASQFNEHKNSDKTALRFVLPPKDAISPPEQETINFNITEPARIKNEVVKIDKEFIDLIPQKRTSEELSFLIEKIKLDKKGEVFIWEEENIYISGYDELKICKELKLPTVKRYKSFKSRESVKLWIFINSMSDLSLTPETKSYIRGQVYLTEKNKLGGLPGNKNRSGQSVQMEKTTSERLAMDFNVSEKTLRRDSKFTEAVNSISQNIGNKFKSDLLSKKLSIPKNAVLKISELPKEKQKEEVKKITHFGYREVAKKNKKQQEVIVKSEKQTDYIIDNKTLTGNDKNLIVFNHESSGEIVQEKPKLFDLQAKLNNLCDFFIKRKDIDNLIQIVNYMGKLRDNIKF